MGIVRFALRYPYTFYVLAAFIVFIGITAIRTMPTDIFPEIQIPVVTVIWQDTGLSTPEMEQRVTTYSQYSISANVNGIKNMEAQTLDGLSIQKIYFQPDVNLDLAIAQIVSATNSIRALMPPGIQPPIVVQFNASSVPVLQLSLSSDSLNEQQLYDYGIYRVRQQLAPIAGVTLPTPAGGKYRQIMVDIDPDKLLARGLTPLDVVNAVNTQNLTLPAGTAKIGNTQYTVRTNAMPSTIDDLNNIPIKFTGGATVFIKDVAQVRDGSSVQQNIVRENGARSVLLSIIKNGNASTLDVVNRVKDALKTMRAAAPPGLKINELFDQSKFVTVVRSGRSARRRDSGRAHRADDPALPRLVAVDAGCDDLDPTRHPLVARCSVFSRRYPEYDDAWRSRARGRHPGRRFHGDDREYAPPAHRGRHGRCPRRRCTEPPASRCRRSCRRSPSAACFTSVVFLEGPAKYLFTPLGLAVVFAMLASYGLSRTLTPITIGMFLKSEHHNAAGDDRRGWRGWLGRFQAGFDRGFERLREGYVALLSLLLHRRIFIPIVAVLVLGLGGTMLPLVGRDFFPAIDGGQIQLHVRAPAGTRIELTERIFQAVEDKIREVIPEKERELIVDNIGLAGTGVQSCVRRWLDDWRQ